LHYMQQMRPDHGRGFPFAMPSPIKNPRSTYRLSAATCGGVREQIIRRFQALISATANERSAISFVENCSHACW